MVFSQESFRSQLDRASSSSLIDKSQYSDRSTPAARQRHYISLAKWIITYIFTFLIAFTIGKWSNIRPSSLSGRSSWFRHRNGRLYNSRVVPMVSQTFKYNRSFSYPPSNHTDAAWETLYPKFGTFFTHTPEAPYRSTLSVFHQLHCLVSPISFYQVEAKQSPNANLGWYSARVLASNGCRFCRPPIVWKRHSDDVLALTCAALHWSATTEFDV